MSLRSKPAGRRKVEVLNVIAGEDIVGEDEEWVAFPVLAVGSETLLFGRKGKGKSQLSEDIAARISSGAALPWEPSGTKHEPRSVVIL